MGGGLVVPVAAEQAVSAATAMSADAASLETFGRIVGSFGRGDVTHGETTEGHGWLS